MSVLVLLPCTSLEAAVGASAVVVSAGLTPGQPGQFLYEYAANVASWITQGIAPTVFTANSVTSIFSTVAAHSLLLGQALQVSNSGGALPTGLSAATTYWVIPLTATTFQLATTLAHALAGTNLTISGNGTGTQTAQAVATAGAGSTFVPASFPVYLDGGMGAQVSVIEDSSGGKCSLTQVNDVR